LRNDLQGFRNELRGGLEGRLEGMRRALEDGRLHLHPRRLQRRIGERRQELGDFSEQLIRTVKSRVGKERLSLARVAATVSAQNPEAPLRRGYCRVVKEGKPVHSARELARGDRLELKLQDGRGDVRVEEVNYDEDL
jgi:exodeoxyribonuclease VII large subunit